MARFTSWRRSELVAGSAKRPSGRLGRTLDVTLTDSSAAGAPATGELQVEFRSAADVTALTRRSIRHRAPAPGVSDAETTKLTHVDFVAPDLPWRYTPEPADGEKLKPWLALVVGTGDEVRLDGGKVTLSRALLAEECHDLDLSWRWAHVYGPDTEAEGELGTPAPGRLSRLLSLRGLRAQTAYTAVLVRTFNAHGEAMWDRTGRVRNGGAPLHALSWWSFTTGEGGDFETLAAALRVPSARDLGRARLTYRAGGEPIGPVEVRGALQSLQTVQEPPPPAQDLLAQQAAQAAREAAGSPEVLGLPEYGRPWVPEPRTGTGWVEQLREDARHRIHAGTGVWTGVEAQDELMRAAVEQAGALPDAAALIARTAAGLATSSLQWERTLPLDPVERLAVLAPLTTRMPAATDAAQTLADAVTGDERNLDRTLLTAAGQRLLGRPERLERNPTATAAELLSSANEPQPGEDPPILPELWKHPPMPPDGDNLYWQLHTVLMDLRTAAMAAHSRYRAQTLPPGAFSDLAEFADYERPFLEAELPLLQDLARQAAPLAHWCGEALFEHAATLAGAADWAEVLERMVRTDRATSLVYGPFQTAILRCLIRGCEAEESPDSWCSHHVAILRIPAPHHGVPISLPGLGNNLGAATDPRGERPPARLGLDERIPELLRGSLAPPRYPLGLDFPTWSLLRTHEPDWFLPGAQDVERNAIVALRTNPAFIDAYLVGLNTQFLSEVRWRGLQVDRWGTPLRMFFATSDPWTGERIPDVVPLQDWPEGSTLGAASHQYRPPSAGDPDPTEPVERLVVLFHTPLFRRYPRTLVYLQKRTVGLDDEELINLELLEEPVLTPHAGIGYGVEDWHRRRHHIGPVFTGTINPDLVFFVFDVPPATLDAYFLVLDEPPAELRFRNDKDISAATSSAAVAARAVDNRTRVVIDGRALEEMGMDPG